MKYKYLARPEIPYVTLLRRGPVQGYIPSDLYAVSNLSSLFPVGSDRFRNPVYFFVGGANYQSIPSFSLGIGKCPGYGFGSIQPRHLPYGSHGIQLFKSFGRIPAQFLDGFPVVLCRLPLNLDQLNAL